MAATAFSLLAFLIIISFTLNPALADVQQRSKVVTAGLSLNKSTGSFDNSRLQSTFYYKSNLEIERTMKMFAKKCSNIFSLYSIGNSVKGFPLWVLEISDKAGQEEPEPSFKFIGNMHGDEPVGRELLLLLADWLCANYKKNPLASQIVEKLHLHLLPTMNPDGFTLRQRGNANNVDLNRDFPDQFFTQNNDETKRQPETKAIMNWVKNNRFTASASLHGGALVANYPWDGTSDGRGSYSQCPDDDTFRFMARIYSDNHYNMSNSSEFLGGITNGAFWYPLYGGMQDWNYIHGGCLELTLEVSDEKWPAAKEIPSIWEQNRMSMLELVASLVKTGVHGQIMSNTGKPLPASIKIDNINHTMKAGLAFGDYHRLLLPGHAYEVTASIHGYASKSTHIVLSEEKPTNIDFILNPNGQEDAMQSEDDRDCNCNCKKENDSEWTRFLQRKYLMSDTFGENVADPVKGTTLFLFLLICIAFCYIICRCRLGNKWQRTRQR